jgi:DNA-binding LytR/AlgR family response regulator
MNKNQLKLLIIEDDLIIAENLKENLIEMGYGEIDVTHNSEIAVNTFKKKIHDICLVDIKLNNSHLDGIETVSKINEIEKVPIIYLTSFSDESTRERAKKTNPAAYLIKPAGKTQIDVSIDLALANFYNKNHDTHNISCPIFSNKGFIFVKTQKRYEKFYFRDIRVFKADGSYVELIASEKKVKVSSTLNKLMEQIKTKDFIRCHRSFAVNIQHIQSFDHESLYIENGKEIIEISIGDQYRAEVLGVLPKI